MSSTEARPGNGDKKSEDIPKEFRQRVIDDLSLRNALADQSPSTPGYNQKLSDFARTVRNACAG